MDLGIFSENVVNIVSRDKGYIKLLRELYKTLIHLILLGNAIALNTRETKLPEPKISRNSQALTLRSFIILLHQQ